jgi:hypothetical protein
LEKIENNSNVYKIKVEFKNNEKKIICSLKITDHENLEGLIYLLNERLISNINTNIDSNENK